eukprot:4895838-Ditylum_brightwellii.AAC.1
MAMMWDDNKRLNFGLYRKPKEVLKYVDTSSTHRPTHLKFDQVCLEHAKALQDAGVALKEFPTIGKLKDPEDEKC